MAGRTENYGLATPGYDDPVDIQVINRNTEAIDAELARNAAALPGLTLATNTQVLSLFEEGGTHDAKPNV